MKHKMQYVTLLSFERYTSTSPKYIQTQAQAQVIQLYNHKSKKLKLKLAFTGTHKIRSNDQKQFSKKLKQMDRIHSEKKKQLKLRKIHISLSDPYPAT